ncbi:hypothetical protein [Tabrizicola sp. M-4]|uniref:hypothetical protein n=1 Tax=Tabrizicola sp. M-4 TaxID=3055847 RepID=UPI003DA7E955
MEIGDLSSISSAGVGLFVSLALIQVVGAGGLGRLRRKLTSLQDVVRTNRLASERAEVNRLNGDLLRLELQLEGLSGAFLKVSVMLLVVAVLGFGLSEARPQLEIGCFGVVSYYVFCLCVPILLFLLASYVIKKKCEGVQKDIAQVEGLVLMALRSKRT